MSMQETTSDFQQTDFPLTADDQIVNKALHWPTNVDRMPVVSGIALAGGLYPITVSLLSFPVVLFLILGDLANQSWLTLIAVYLMGGLQLVIQGTIGFAVGGLYAFLVGFVILLLSTVVLRSLRAQCSPVWAGAFAGGLTGFLCTSYYFVLAMLPGSNQSGFLIWILLLGPMLATIMGQVGGVWGAWIMIKDKPKQWNPWYEWKATADSRWFRFRIYHLMWLAVWCSLLLALIRLVGLPYGPTLTIFGVWIVYQAATLYLGGALVQLVQRRRQRALEALHVEQSAT